MAEFKSIKNWQEDDRPREKMQQRGVASLTNAELLAILIASGTREKSALDLARDVLQLAHNDLRELGRLTLPELQKIKGIGEARAITICAAMELGRRRQVTEGTERVTISKSKDAAAIFMPLLQDLNYEAFCVLYLNNAGKLIKHEMESAGGITETVADTRLILKKALLHEAVSIVVAHNHPSGSREISRSDKMLTEKLHNAAAAMEIKLLDHIIIVGNDYISLRDEGVF